MKFSLQKIGLAGRGLFLALGMLPALAQAGTAKKEIALEESPTSRGIGLSIDTVFDYVAPASFRGTVDGGRISTYSLSTTVQQQIRLNDGLSLVAGGIWRQFWFDGGTAGDLLPNSAGSLAATGGVRWRFLDRWSLFVQGGVGIFTDWAEVTSRDWNFDVAATLGYSFSDNLQVFVGAAYFPQFQIPVLPTAGLRWQINDAWRLNLLLPKPTLEWALSEQFTLYGFGQLAGGRFRVGDGFGDAVGRSNLNGRWLSYLDLRTGGGLQWNPLPWANWRVEVGSSVYREFEYDGADFSLRAGPALFASTSLGLRF